MKLFSYWRSSAAYRVRIALNLKQIPVDMAFVHLIKDGGQQRQADYRQLNPAQLVPSLQDNELTLNQSLAIIDYLEAKQPIPALLPDDLALAMQVRAFALDIACDIHPLNNLRVLQYLTGTLGLNETQKVAWIHHWLATGFAALEQRLASYAGVYCFGDDITLADVCLAPQVYNALRFQLDMTPYPTILRVYEQLMQVPAFVQAAPEQQADAQS
jgi:maleylacetoacetate isomerase